MPFNLRNRHFLTLLDFTPQEIRFLLDLAADLKKAKYTGTEQQTLCRKNIVLLFEKDSTRTRCAFEIAAHDQGANVTYLGPSGSQMGNKESVKDTARVLGRMYDAIEYRGFGQDIVQQLADYSGVPVFNGLTDQYHPTQVLADFLTIQEQLNKPLSQVIFTYVGDGRNNMCNSLMIGSAKMGLDFRVLAPKEVHPEKDLVSICTGIANDTGAKITITNNIDGAVKNADVIYTDVWVSMGEPEHIWAERITMLKEYQVNTQMMEKTGNPKSIFLHCLPAFHNTETRIAKRIYEQFGLKEMEVTEEVFESSRSKVFDQAENRVHTIKAVLVACLS